VDRAALVPAPANRIPILCGGMSAPAYRRAVEHGDGFIFMGALHEITLPAWRELREQLVSHERSVEGFRAEYYATRADFGGLGTSDLISELKTWEANGGTHACIKTMGMGFTTLDAHLQHLENAARSLGRG
jgi:alkanesulfonate monooxygenase SsuD/methylene tetrahydromethanopterin reductase-like flavin-dependent oxidoreductase (luciferase family)